MSGASSATSVPRMALATSATSPRMNARCSALLAAADAAVPALPPASGSAPATAAGAWLAAIKLAMALTVG